MNFDEIEAMLEAPFKEKKVSINHSENIESSSNNEDMHREREREKKSHSPEYSRKHYSDYRNDRRDSRREREEYYARRERDDYHRSGRDRNYYSRERSDYHREHRRSYDDFSDRRSREYDRFGSKSRERSPVRQTLTPTSESGDKSSRTVFCMQLAARLTNRELYDFLRPCGRIIEAKIVQDRHSRKSKGVAYVEFQSASSVPRAIAMSSTPLLGIPIIIHPSDSEKNNMGESQLDEKNRPPPIASRKLFVNQLPTDLNENDVRELFEKFGELEKLNLHIDSLTGRSKGYAVIQYRNIFDARQAVKHLHNYEIGGKVLNIGAVSEKDQKLQPVGLEDEISLNSYGRLELMAKLARDEVKSTSSRALSTTTITSQPTRIDSQCVVLKNMFDPDDETEENWVKDLEEDVRLECQKYGKVCHIAVDKQSQGHIYLKFDSNRSADRVIEVLNGRLFGGRKVVAMKIAPSVYYASYPIAATK